MVRLLFSFDGDCPSDVKEAHALYLIHGSFQICDGDKVFVEEVVPLIELAVMLSRWLAINPLSTNKSFSFFPDSFAAELLHLAPVNGSQYRLLCKNEDGVTTRYLTADFTDFQTAFTKFLADLGQALWEQYNLRLENILRPFV